MEEVDKLFCSLCIPSSSNSYGIAIEYMRNWFLSKFDADYWKTVYVDGKFVLDDFVQFNKLGAIKNMKPALAIVPQVSFDHDREKVDLYQGSIHQMINRSRADSSFFSDIDRNMHISLMMEQLQMNFTFRMKVSSRAHQMELYKYAQMAFRIGSTQGEYIDIDFHVPYSMILQLANDVGFEIIDNKIKNVISFVNYLNHNSTLPILYKYRNVNGKNEFFMRMPNMYTHVSCQESLNADDGDREGMVFNNYMIDMQVILQMPMPKAYSYYSTKQPEILKHINNGELGSPAVLSIELINAPEKNSNGWDKLITTDYYEEDLTIPLSIEFDALFNESDILKTIKYNNSIQISSRVFIDFVIYNDGIKLEYDIDWEKLILNTNNIVSSNTTSIVIYVDLEYINDTLINLKQLYEDRLR